MNRRVHPSSAARSAITASWWRSLADHAAVNWGDVARRLPFAADMNACVQDPTYHAEGDVWTHTIAVMEQVRCNRAQAAVADDRWAGLFLAALLHDIAKPATRSEEFDAEGRSRVHHYGHARMGALMAWEFLWRLGLPRPLREQVFHLVRWHQRPFHLTFAPALERDVITFSQVGNWRELLALARADNLGRIAPNTAETAASLDLLEEEIVKRACMDGPWRFPSDGARVWFGRAAGRSPWFEPPAPTGSHVVVLCGLPGAGKDTHCRKAFPGWPQVSLDQLREALEVLPNDNQGQVIQAAMEEARAHLRAKRRFVWNATNVSRLNRDKAVGLCLGYDAFIEIHAFDPPPDRLLIQNQNRDAKVPQTVIERLIRKWEPPSILEAHRVVWID